MSGTFKKAQLRTAMLTAACAVSAGLVAPAFLPEGAQAAVWPFSSSKGRDTERTLSLYQVHTKENITVTYWRNGRYIPSAMQKLNWFLRDWRRDKATRMDPETIDLMWKLHADLGSKSSIHIISGFRSSQTNAMLKRIGRRVARRSMHIKGQAIDLYFPDVSSAKIRASALVREIGGVGYYPRSGKHGFVHIDSGRVRHWPRMGSSRLASLKKRYRYTVGARFRNAPTPVLTAQNIQKPTQVSAMPTGPKNIVPSVGAETVPATPKARPTAKPVIAAVPKPRPRPYEVLVLAAANMQIAPASAPVPKHNFAASPSAAHGTLGVISERTALNAPADDQRTNSTAKASFRNEIPAIAALRPYGGNDNSYSTWLVSGEDAIRSDGVPQPFRSGKQARVTALPTMASLNPEDTASLKRMIASIMPGNNIQPSVDGTQRSSISGKSDRLVVNRTGKGDFSGGPVKSSSRQDRLPAKAAAAKQGFAIDLNGKKARLARKGDFNN